MILVRIYSQDLIQSINHTGRKCRGEKNRHRWSQKRKNKTEVKRLQCLLSFFKISRIHFWVFLLNLSYHPYQCILSERFARRPNRASGRRANRPSRFNGRLDKGQGDRTAVWLSTLRANRQDKQPNWPPSGSHFNTSDTIKVAENGEGSYFAMANA